MTIFLPVAEAALTTQDFAAPPSISAVQAPHWPSPQPYFVLVRWRGKLYPASFRVTDDSPGTFVTGIPSPSGRQAGELEAASYGIMNDGR